MADYAIGASLSTKLRFSKKSFIECVSAFTAALLPTLTVGLTSLRTLPLSSGFVSYPLQDTNLIPYRDYFDPVTPFTYFEAHITANANYGLFFYVLLVTLTVVPMFGLASYALARIFVGRISSILLSMLMEAWLVSLRLEQVGGWNTQMLMLMSIGFTLFVFAVVGSRKNLKNGGAGRTSRAWYAVLSGVSFSLACLDKQTCIISLTAMIALIVGWYFWEKPVELSERIARAAGFFLIGIAPPFALTFVYLISHHAFLAFVKDMLSGGGKNPSVVHFPSILFDAIRSEIPTRYLVACLLVIAVLFLWEKNLARLIRLWQFRPASNLIVFIALLGCSFVMWRFSSSFNQAQDSQFVIQDALICCIPILIKSVFRNLRGLALVVITIADIAVLPFCYDWGNSNSLLGALTNVGTTERFEVAFIILFVIFSSVLAMSRRLGGSFNLVIESRMAGLRLSIEEFRFLLILSNAFSISVLVNFYSSGGGFYVQWFIPSALVYLAIAILLLRSWFSEFQFQNVVYLLVGLVVVSSLTVTFYNPYSWFNWVEGNVFSAHTASDFPRNYGFQLSHQTSYFYSRVKKAATEAAGLSGIGKDATVFSYPSIPTAAEATGLRNYTGIKCAVLWFDVCPNSQAASDLKYFERHQPNVVIWEPIPRATMIANEKGFVHGRSALEDWEAFRRKEVALGNWILVDHFIARNSNGWMTDIYAVIKS